MSELRQRLVDEGFGVGTWQETVGERAIEIDEALRLFAEWLRERATELYNVGDDHLSYDAPGGAVDLAYRLADEIAPKP